MKCSEVEINEMYEAKSHDSEVPLNKIPKTIFIQMDKQV